MVEKKNKPIKHTMLIIFLGVEFLDSEYP